MAKSSRQRDVVTSIVHYNRDRDPPLLERKFAAMAADPFVFLRGAAHRYYETLEPRALPADAPLAWLCGDLHLENFGSFRGDNRLTYFDLNDFDEAALGPCTWDLLRLLVSVRVGAHVLEMSAAEAIHLCRSLLRSVTAELRTGKPRWIERDIATGIVARLLGNVIDRRRRQLLDRRAPRVGKHRQLLVDGVRTLAATHEQARMVRRLIERSFSHHPHPERFAVLGIVRRVAGTGSLGLPRFAVLTEGKGSPDRNIVLDVKAARPSCVPAPRGVAAARDWRFAAERVVSVQRQLQAVPPAHLSAERAGAESFVIKELQPQMDKLNLAECKGRDELLAPIVFTMGELVAWSWLRTSSWRGSANRDALIAFGERRDWQPHLFELSATLAAQTVAEWHVFRDAWQAGKIDVTRLGEPRRPAHRQRSRTTSGPAPSKPARPPRREHARRR